MRPGETLLTPGERQAQDGRETASVGSDDGDERGGRQQLRVTRWRGDICVQLRDVTVNDIEQ